MWKKILWIVAALYPLSVVFIMMANAGADLTIWSAVSGFVFFLIPLAVLVYELREGKPSNIWVKILLVIAYLVSFVLVGVGAAGYYSFNTPTALNLIKGLPLLLTLLALTYFAFKRIFKRTA